MVGDAILREVVRPDLLGASPRADLRAAYRSLLRGLALTRPKYAEQIRELDARYLEATYQALIGRDLWTFDARYEEATDQANVYHVDTGHPYIRWVRPEEPPDRALDLQLGS